MTGVLVAIVAFVAYTHTRAPNNEPWVGFPRQHACAAMTPAQDFLRDMPGYTPGVPARSVQAQRALIEDLGEKKVRITVIFAGAPKPVTKALLPGRNTRTPEPGSWDFTIQLLPYGINNQTASPINFDDGEDARGRYQWAGGQYDGLDGPSRYVPVDTWRFENNTFSVTADLSDYFDIPEGAAFNPDIRVTPQQWNSPATGYEANIDDYVAMFWYPSYQCTSSTGAPPTTAAQTTRSRATTATTTPQQQHPGMDQLGFQNSHARCDTDDEPAVTARTAQSQVVICIRSNSTYYYRGVRLSDQAPSEYDGAQTSNNRSFNVTNGSVTYTVSPTALIITESGTVIANEPMIDYRTR
ncbi:MULTISPECIES: hypothetical protein [Actinomycetes]|uniref:hypothetical protein n=1 Tax=Actinomycetes TaxID=1760 RepID=UPI00068BB67A|nr:MULTISPECIES: hypothetical protein [Actinomycetes]